MSASARLNVFSVHRLHRTFCLRALCIVSPCRVRSYGREKRVFQGLPVLGLMRSRLAVDDTARGRQAAPVTSPSPVEPVRLAMSLSLVLLQEHRGFEP